MSSYLVLGIKYQYIYIRVSLYHNTYENKSLLRYFASIAILIRLPFVFDGLLFEYTEQYNVFFLLWWLLKRKNSFFRVRKCAHINLSILKWRYCMLKPLKTIKPFCYKYKIPESIRNKRKHLHFWQKSTPCVNSVYSIILIYKKTKNLEAKEIQKPTHRCTKLNIDWFRFIFMVASMLNKKSERGRLARTCLRT